MKNNPDQNRQNGEDTRSSGTFKLNIDESSLAPGTSETAERRRDSTASYEELPLNKKNIYTEKERKEEAKAHKKRDKIKARKNRRIFSWMWLAMVLLISFTLASYLIVGSNDFFGIGRIQGKASVEIPVNVTSKQLAGILQDKGVISSTEFFTIYCGVTADMAYFEPGTYELETNLDYEDIINRLQGGNESREVVTVTFPEGLTALEVAALLEENGVCKSADFLTALNSEDFNNYDMISQIGSTQGKYYKLEGYLFPDTYDFYKGEEMQSIVGKMVENFQSKVEGVMQADIKKSGMTTDQIVTLASIIQGEAANVNDMYLVSAVLHNRLEFGADYGIYTLGCDATVFYPYKNRDKIPAEGAIPYGNYDTTGDVQGLPAGAVCSPSLDALKAALKPSTANGASEYLYFCHSADGQAYYASTEEGHIENQYAAGLLD